MSAVFDGAVVSLLVLTLLGLLGAPPANRPVPACHTGGGA